MNPLNPLTTDTTGDTPQPGDQIISFSINSRSTLLGSALLADGFANITVVDTDGSACFMDARQLSIDLFGDAGDRARAELEALLDAGCRTTVTGIGTRGPDGLFEGTVVVCVGPREIYRARTVTELLPV